MATPNVNATVSAADNPPKGFSDMLLQFNMLKKGTQDGDKNTAALAQKELELKFREDAIQRERTYEKELEKLREKMKEANQNLNKDKNQAQMRKRIEDAIKSGDREKAALLLQLYDGGDSNVSQEYIKVLIAQSQLPQDAEETTNGFQKKSTSARKKSATDKLKETRKSPAVSSLNYDNIGTEDFPSGPTSPMREASDNLSHAMGEDIDLDNPATQATAIQSPDFTSDMLMTILSGGKWELPTQIAVVSAIERYGDYFSDEEKKFLIFKALSDDTDTAVYATLLGSLEKDLEAGNVDPDEYEVQKRELLRLQAATKSSSSDTEDKYAISVDWSNAPGKVGEYLQQSHNIASTNSTKDARAIKAISLWDAYKADMQKSIPDDKKDRAFGQTRMVMKHMALGNLAGEEVKKRNGVEQLYIATFQLEEALRKLNPSDLGFVASKRVGAMSTLDELSALINDPEVQVSETLIQFFTEMKSAIQRYRQAMSGAAFTESEAKEYASMFPQISASMGSNMAILNGMRKASFDSMVNFYDGVYGSEISNWLYLPKETPYTDFVLPDTEPRGLDGKPRPRPSQAQIDKLSENIRNAPSSKSDVQLQSDIRSKYYLTYAEAYEVVKAARSGNIYQLTDPKIRIKGAENTNVPIDNNDGASNTTGMMKPTPTEIELMQAQAQQHFPEGPPDDQIEPTILALQERWPGLSEEEAIEIMYGVAV